MDQLDYAKTPRDKVFASRQNGVLCVILPTYEIDVATFVGLSVRAGTFKLNGREIELRMMDNSDEINTINVAEAIIAFAAATREQLAF